MKRSSLASEITQALSQILCNFMQASRQITQALMQQHVGRVSRRDRLLQPFTLHARTWTHASRWGRLSRRKVFTEQSYNLSPIADTDNLSPIADTASLFLHAAKGKNLTQVSGRSTQVSAEVWNASRRYSDHQSLGPRSSDTICCNNKWNNEEKQESSTE